MSEEQIARDPVFTSLSEQFRFDPAEGDSSASPEWISIYQDGGEGWSGLDELVAELSGKLITASI